MEIGDLRPDRAEDGGKLARVLHVVVHARIARAILQQARAANETDRVDLQAIATEVADYQKKSFEEDTAALEKLFGI